jgi:hypothetical protein
MHSEFFESPSFHGFTFVAQIRGGEVHFGAKLTMPITERKHTFLIWQHEWDRTDGPFILNLNSLYKETCETPEVQNWIETTVKPWVNRTKMKWLEQQYEHDKQQLVQMEAELDRLRSIE